HQHQARPWTGQPRVHDHRHAAGLRRGRHGRVGYQQRRDARPRGHRADGLLLPARAGDDESRPHHAAGVEEYGLSADLRPAQNRLARVPGVPGPLAIWRMALLALGFTVGYMIFRWGFSVALGIFSNVWIAGAASALIASFIVAPQLFTNLVSKMKTKSGLQVKTTTGTPDAERGDV